MAEYGEDLSHLSPADRALVEEWLGTRDAILEAAESGELDTYTPYPHQKRLHEAPHSSRFLLGANRIGKSRFLQMECKYFAEGKHPFRPDVTKPAKLIWACCPTEELMLMYQFPEIKAAIGEANIARTIMGAHPRIILKNGCTILFKYYAQGSRAFPSAGVDVILFDEEPTWSIFEECWARRSTRKLHIVGAITTVGGLTPLVTKITSKADPLPDCHYETAKLDDNPAIPEGERDKMKAGLRSNPVAYRIRILGEILAIGGTARFDGNMLLAMEAEDVIDPTLRLDFDMTHERWIQSELGKFRIWDMPKEGHEYCLGVDTAEGLNIGYSDTDPIYDETSIQILDRITRKFVAEYTVGDVEPGVIGDLILPRISRLYNRAWANVEINNHGYTVVTLAKRHMAARLYSPIKDRTEKGPEQTRQFGSFTSDKSKNFMIDTLAEEIHHRTIEVPSGYTVLQMQQFVNLGNKKTGAQEGAKDDRVIACALACVCDRDLPAPRIKKAPTVQDQLRALALRRPKHERKFQYFRKIGKAA